MTAENRCPQCGAELPADAPRGHCPACLLKGGLKTETNPGPSGDPGTSDFVPPKPEELAAFFPDLEILEFIGRGGMGMVYKARQKHLDRLVALKILSPAIARDPAFSERFLREARAMAMLSHPHIVAVYDFGQKLTPGASEETNRTPLYYFLMEFIDGLTLRQLLDAGKLAPQTALAIVPQICEALQFAHDKGVVHRDIKPENILINRDGQVKIADFGLAKLLGQPAKDFSITGTGQVMGTPHYMAPEQLEHPQDVDHRADIYSLGVVFYQMLTGELPLGRFAPPSRKVQVDVRLDEVVLRALEKEPELRYQQASEVKSEVETIVAGSVAQAPGAASGMPGRDAVFAWLRFREYRSKTTVFGWPLVHIVLRWTARVLGTLMLLMFLLFAIGEGMPAIWTQPASVRVEFVGFFLMALGMLIGWRWEGWAALLILAGTLQFHIVEWRLVLQGALELPLIVGVLYGLCWWLERLPAAPKIAGKAHGVDENATALREVRGPAIGLIVTSLVNWVAIFVLAIVMIPFAMRKGLPPDLFLLLAGILAAATAVILNGASRMERLESLASARTAAVLAMLIGPGYFVGFPVGIWSLVVLSRPKVRQAFSQRSGLSWRIRIALALLVVATVVAVARFAHLRPWMNSGPVQTGADNSQPEDSVPSK